VEWGANAVALYLTDRWIWDFWFAEDGADVHVFYLQAPRALAAPDARHRNATIGHAVSTDLVVWTILPDALAPGPPGSFDDLATWTGSVLRHDRQWWLFYSAVSRREDVWVQRVGYAQSVDLLRWTKPIGRAVVEADALWYEKRGPRSKEETWRDPWVFWDEDTRQFHMLLTARANSGPPDGRGVIGHAWSSDLMSWQVGPPLSEPGEFMTLEVPQLVQVESGWWILFSALANEHSAARLARAGVLPEGGTHYLRASRKLGPYALERDQFLVGDAEGRHYAGRMLQRNGRWYFFAWQQFDESGRFFGALTDPMEVTATNGQLTVHVPLPGG
jgi:beta-fructofuranosidase